MEEKERMFLPVHFERHESVIKKKVRKFMLGYNLLNEFLSMKTDPNNRESMEFYSNIYSDMAPLLTEITCSVVNNGYSGRRKRVDNAIFVSQKILGLLKILHLRYMISISSPDPFGDSRWFEISPKTNYEIVKEITKLFNEMYSFNVKDKGWDIYSSFFLRKKPRVITTKDFRLAHCLIRRLTSTIYI